MKNKSDKIMNAVVLHDLVALEQLLSNEDDVVLKNRALCFASTFDYTEVVDLLLCNGASASAGDSFALRWASCNNNVKMIKLLLDNGADVHACDNLALCEACKGGCTEAVKSLLEAGADCYADDGMAIYQACVGSHVGIIKIFVERNIAISNTNWKILTGEDPPKSLSTMSSGEILDYIISSFVAKELLCK